MVKITVIVPVKNAGRYLRQCLDSIACQTLQSIEVICIDDGSTDDSCSILAEFEKNDSRFRLIAHDNSGPGAARNRGINEAKGKYVCMMDADDYYPNENVLEMLFFEAEKNSVQVCGGNILIHERNGEIKPANWNFKNEGMVNSREHPCLYGQTRFIYNRDFLVSEEIFYPPLIRFEDPPFLLKALLKAKRYYIIQENVYVYRVGHKKIQTSHRIANDILVGILMCLQLARDYDLYSLYERTLAFLLFSVIEYIHPYLIKRDADIWSGTKRIVELCRSFDSKIITPFSDEKEYELYIHEIEMQFARYRSGGSYIIYGAGRVATSFLESFPGNRESILGMATSWSPSTSHFQKIPIKRIDEYEDLFLKVDVVVAASEKNEREMIDHLIKLGVSNYSTVTMTKMIIAKAMAII